MNIGKAIKSVRQSKYPTMNQTNFAKSVGITQTYLSQIEGGSKVPSTDMLNRISDFCEIPLPIIFWFSIEESDISKEKRQAFKIVKPSVDAMINSVV